MEGLACEPCIIFPKVRRASLSGFSLFTDRSENKTVGQRILMHIKSINLPSSERFPCGKRDIKRVLVGIDSLKVSFQHNDLRTPRYEIFSFDGIVIANAKASVNWECAYFNLFQIDRNLYPQSASDEFKESVLPAIRTWIVESLNNQNLETASKEELFVVWHKGIHEIKYLKLKY